MPYPRKDIAEQRFGRLVAIGVVGVDKHRSPLWECICDCGGGTTVPTHNLTRGNTSSCGCLRREMNSALNRKHGGTGTSEYRCWKSMRQRCNSPNSKDWRLYGGRGIKVCERWNDYTNFIADMGEKPTPAHSIDRWPDVNGNYEPDNCRWATAVEQANNKRTSKQRRAA